MLHLHVAQQLVALWVYATASYILPMIKDAELNRKLISIWHWSKQIIARHTQLKYKKRKDSLRGSLGRVWFAAELEFPKILVSRLPKHTQNVNTEYAGKSEWSKQLHYLYGTSLLQHWYILILLLWY